jgi:hypothetical protein
MASERGKQLVLAGLVAILAVVLIRAWMTAPSDEPASGARPAAARRQAQSGPAPEAPDVKLEALDADGPRPTDARRNLFRFGAVTRTAPPERTTPDRTFEAPPAPPRPAGPTTPPISLKFIGIVEAPEQSKRMAVLSDNRGVYWGREGDTIEGRYRIVRIGTESIELAHLVGNGRQTIRLSGS